LFFSTINALKYFKENANEYHVIAAGSLLGIKLAGKNPFPHILSRMSLQNLKKDDNTCNYPLYAISLFPVVLKTA
jgi:hypothetical protein